MIFALGMSVLWGRMRLATGSVWPAIIGHCASNAVIEGPFKSYTHGTYVSLWVGESGIVLVFAVVAISYALTKFRFAPGCHA